MAEPEKRFQSAVIDGVFVGPNACSLCEKWIMPDRAGVPSSEMEHYCQGHWFYCDVCGRVEQENCEHQRADCSSSGNPPTEHLRSTLSATQRERDAYREFHDAHAEWLSMDCDKRHWNRIEKALATINELRSALSKEGEA